MADIRKIWGCHFIAGWDSEELFHTGLYLFTLRFIHTASPHVAEWTLYMPSPGKAQQRLLWRFFSTGKIRCPPQEDLTIRHLSSWWREKAARNLSHFLPLSSPRPSSQSPAIPQQKIALAPEMVLLRKGVFLCCFCDYCGATVQLCKVCTFR